MRNSDSLEDSAYQSGNIFGWRFSFISLGIILVTLIAVIISENYKKNLQGQTPHNIADSIEVEQLDSILILEQNQINPQ
ncbi:MAG: hypothetical protein R3E32_11725 [Chitinophagales bacterium]